jgi:hypothetical protein
VIGALGFIVGPMPEVATPADGAREAARILDAGADGVAGKAHRRGRLVPS